VKGKQAAMTFRSLLIAAALLAAAPVAASAQDNWPTRPVKAITTTSAGGLSDIFMRALGEELRQKWGQPLIIENRPGGSMNTGTRACADSAPDGYTICITNADAMLYNQFLFKSIPFNPETSLIPITNAFHLIHMLVINSQLGAKSVDELCNVSKQKPGTLSYLAPGAPMVLYMQTLQKEKGCDWVRVPFRGGGEAVNAIMSGSTPIGLFGEGNVIGNVRAGQMTALVMLNNIRSPNFPEVPLLTEIGYNGPPSRSWYGIFAPAGVQKPFVDRVSKDINEVIARPEFRDRHLTARSLVPAANTPEQFAEMIKRERPIAEKVVKDAGFEPQ
jgi:tripartite-type tricarboxylate transporter receptor subunit TctC